MALFSSLKGLKIVGLRMLVNYVDTFDSCIRKSDSYFGVICLFGKLSMLLLTFAEKSYDLFSILDGL